jgi:hypothetical protein
MNIADALNIVIQIERRPGIRFVSEVLSLGGFDADNDRYTFSTVYKGNP